MKSVGGVENEQKDADEIQEPNGEGTNVPAPKAKSWAPWQLRPHGLSVLLASQIVTIVVTVTLLSISDRKFGLITVPESPRFLADNPNIEKALWSSIFFWSFLQTL